ncbi:hypothetical protein ACFXP3_05510, partial [Streptomyces sp. NPDC059096]
WGGGFMGAGSGRGAAGRGTGVSIVERQKRLVLLGRERAQARGELPYEPDAVTADRTADLIFDVIAGAVVNRTMVSAQPVDGPWARTFTELLLGGLTPR